MILRVHKSTEKELVEALQVRQLALLCSEFLVLESRMCKLGATFINSRTVIYNTFEYDFLSNIWCMHL